ncbi:DPEP2 neighbor protein-like isoform X2 [Cavia porcellus]|uniref:DPEP2 neighbor protein-like isoform X2 n=1 Tax=Cavia porcellus TaxID=10141 RepID=UPI002FE1A17C
MSGLISYIQSNLSSVSWECNPAAVLPTAPPTPVYYHVLYRGCGETQVGWHGETYCLVGGYRAFGDAAITTPTREEKPASRWPYGNAPIVIPARAEAQNPASKWVYVDTSIIIPAKIEAQKSMYVRVPKKP